MTWRFPVYAVLIGTVAVAAVLLGVAQLDLSYDGKQALGTLLAGLAGVASGAAALLLDYRATERKARRERWKAMGW
jgi:hypothetical protein